MALQKNEAIDFRKALGAFATGVTIVTTRDKEGSPIGVTASSFNSVSLDPPLVLWSLAKRSHSHDAFCTSGHFAIHVLSDTQEEVSNRFARGGQDKFTGIEWVEGSLRSPLLTEHTAVFECRTKYQYEGGDHVIFVGEVVNFEACDKEPLLFHAGSYAERRPRPPTAYLSTVDLEQGQFTDDFLFYLIARAYFQTSRPARAKMAELDLDDGDYPVLAGLSMHSPASAETIRATLDHTGRAPDDETISAMVDRELLAERDGLYELASPGRSKLIEILAVSQAFESDIAEKLSPGELAEIKRLLRRLIDLTGADVPVGWRT